jgi:hypothetical protein
MVVAESAFPSGPVGPQHNLSPPRCFHGIESEIILNKIHPFSVPKRNGGRRQESKEPISCF